MQVEIPSLLASWGRTSAHPNTPLSGDESGIGVRSGLTAGGRYSRLPRCMATANDGRRAFEGSPGHYVRPARTSAAGGGADSSAASSLAAAR